MFLLDCQQANNSIMKSTCIEDDERSFTFLLFLPDQKPDDPDASVVRFVNYIIYFFTCNY